MEYHQYILKHRDGARVLILGSYQSKKCIEKLRIAEKWLITNGFTNTKLVMDFPDEPRFHKDDDVHNILKSEHYLKWGDILLFIFFKECNQGGAISEFTHMICDEKTKHKQMAILYQHDKERRLSSLVIGDAKRFTVPQDVFKNINELKDKLLSRCINIFDKLL